MYWPTMTSGKRLVTTGFRYPLEHDSKGQVKGQVIISKGRKAMLKDRAVVLTGFYWREMGFNHLFFSFSEKDNPHRTLLNMPFGAFQVRLRSTKMFVLEKKPTRQTQPATYSLS